MRTLSQAGAWHQQIMLVTGRTKNIGAAILGDEKRAAHGKTEEKAPFLARDAVGGVLVT